MLRIADDALGAPASVCKFVAGRYSPSAQRRAKRRRSNASAGTSVRSHAQPIRLVNEAAGGRIRRTFFALGQIFD
jgi:hypothetical protein